jgi:TonB family protein
MSLISSSTPSTHAVAPQRRLAAAGPRRSRRAIYYSLLACVILIGGAVLYRGATPWQTVLPTLLTRQSPSIRTNDQGLRQLAIKAPPPIYPASAVANNIMGVVVAAVTIDVQGKLKSVKIVESPDAATGRAVRDAVTQWVFRPLTVPSGANLIAGNMIFYFHRTGGRVVVSSAEEMQAIKSSTTEGTDLQPTVHRLIDEAEFRRIRVTSVPVVLDIRSRPAHLESHRSGAVNIPIRELQTRGGAELPRSRLIVIDCFAEHQPSGLCEMAVHILRSEGFSHLAILNRSIERRSQ